MTAHLLNNEKELLLRVAEGNEAAFREIFNAYAPVLYPMMIRIVKIPAAAEDIIQETFLRVWIARDQLPGIEQPRSWILRIAYYRAFTYLRSKARHQKAMTIVTNLNTTSLAKNETEDAVTFNALEAQLKEAIGQLPAQQKKVYQLSRQQGLKTDAIAELMNLSPQSVKNTLGRALKFIREYMEAYGLLILIILVKILTFFKYT